MANDTRLRLLHALAREGELGVSALAREVGMKPQAISNQLQRLADRGILDSRRNGNGVLYRIVDPCVVNLLDQGWCLLKDSRRRSNSPEPSCGTCATTALAVRPVIRRRFTRRPSRKI